MKGFVVGVLLLVGLLGVPFSSPALDRLTRTAFAEAQQDPATVTVYVTRTGKKYHRGGCRYLSRSKMTTTLKEAVAHGFGPCSVCKPPTLARSH
jgi:competence protein ComEC